MNTKQVLAQQRVNMAIVEFLKELFEHPYKINDSTIDEVKNSTVDSAKQNIDASFLTDSEKRIAKQTVEQYAHDLTQCFKLGMKQAGRIG